MSDPVNNPTFEEFKLDSLDLDDKPELALVTARRAIEARLELLVGYLAPNEVRAGPEVALNVLRRSKTFDDKTVRAIREVLVAADPISHGRKVPPSVAAVVVESALRVTTALDQMVAGLRAQLQAKDSRKRLAYAYLALPSNSRRSIAIRLDLFEEGDDSLTPKDFAQTVFERAMQFNALKDLWVETAHNIGEIPKNPPDDLE